MPRTTHTPQRRTQLKPDQVLAAAIDQAREALAPIAHEREIGEHLEARADGPRLVTHYFECLKKGYRGWRWVATLARVPRARKGTVCEVALVPGDDALLAPEWVPWAQRLEPGDISRSDTLPYQAEDARLDNGYEDAASEEWDERTIEEIGLGRPRVLSASGRAQAAKRWYDSEHGPQRTANNRRKLPDHTCSNCGFMMKIAGSMRRAFGVCANEWSPDDGHVVSLDHTCGAHSETDVEHRRSQWEPTPPRVNELDIEVV